RGVPRPLDRPRGPGQAARPLGPRGRPPPFGVAQSPARPNPPPPPVGALRAHHLGAYGYSRPTTPRLDRLAADGVRFAAAFTSGPMTLPSMGQLFTASPFPTPTRPTLVSRLFAGRAPRTPAIVNNLHLFHWPALD